MLYFCILPLFSLTTSLSAAAWSAGPQCPRDWPCLQKWRSSPAHPTPQYPVLGPGTTSLSTPDPLYLSI